MFDHVKCVKRYTTFACHVYDSCHCKVMTIALCDMISETHDAQAYLWHDVMAKHKVHNFNFKGFMADSTQANWNVVREIYGTGDKTVPMQENERSCLLHWTKCMQRATNNSSSHSLGMNTNIYAFSIKTLKQWTRHTPGTWQSVHGGFLAEQPPTSMFQLWTHD